MNFTQTYKQVVSSKIFKDFIKENSKAELVAGFFILDFLATNNQKSLDYKLNDKIFTFSVNEQNQVEVKEDELIQDKTRPQLTKISPSIKVDLESLENIAKTETQKNNIKSQFQKIIAVLQIYEDKQVWNLTCILEGLIILNIIIDSDTGKIIKFDRKSMSDFMRKV